MRDKLEDAFARLRVAFEADDYTPMEDVIEAVLQRFTGDLHLVSENSRLRAENERLRAAVTLGMHYLKGRYPVPVKEKEVLAQMQAALDVKEKP